MKHILQTSYTFQDSSSAFIFGLCELFTPSSQYLWDSFYKLEDSEKAVLFQYFPVNYSQRGAGNLSSLFLVFWSWETRSGEYKGDSLELLLIS